MDLAWMAWTWQIGVFFVAIVLVLSVLTVLAVRSPEAERVGVLRIATTRGDRLFVSLLGSAFIHFIWLAATGADLWWASIISLFYAAAVFRWV